MYRVCLSAIGWHAVGHWLTENWIFVQITAIQFIVFRAERAGVPNANAKKTKWIGHSSSEKFDFTLRLTRQPTADSPSANGWHPSANGWRVGQRLTCQPQAVSSLSQSYLNRFLPNLELKLSRPPFLTPGDYRLHRSYYLDDRPWHPALPISECMWPNSTKLET